MYEVGVHIADVSYFVKAGSALDEVASSRATSVYLIQRVSSVYSRPGSQGETAVLVALWCVQVIPMLPRLLCEQLCSLNPNEVRKQHTFGPSD